MYSGLGSFAIGSKSSTLSLAPLASGNQNWYSKYSPLFPRKGSFVFVSNKAAVGRALPTPLSCLSSPLASAQGLTWLYCHGPLFMGVSSLNWKSFNGKGCLINFWNSHSLGQWFSVQFSCSVMSNPMDCNTPGHPDHHQLPEFTQTHVHWVGDAILQSHPLSSPSPPAFNLSQHQGLFKWVSSSHQVAEELSASTSVLPMNIQDCRDNWMPPTTPQEHVGVSGDFWLPQSQGECYWHLVDGNHAARHPTRHGTVPHHRE